MAFAVGTVSVPQLSQKAPLARTPQSFKRTVPLLITDLREPFVVGDLHFDHLEVFYGVVKHALQDVVSGTPSHTINYLRPAIHEVSEVV